MSEIKYVCFDIGGVANVRLPRTKLISLGQEFFGPDFSQEVFDQMFRPKVNDVEIWREYQNGTLTTKQYLEFALSAGGYLTHKENQHLFRTLLEEACGEQFYPVLNLVDALKRNDYRTSVLSNNNEIMYNTPSAEAIKQRVDVAISSHEIGCSKPHWDAFCILLGKIKADAPGKVLFIDDKLENIQAAQRYGLQGFHFRSKELGLDKAFWELTEYLYDRKIRI